MANILKREKQVRAVSALAEGSSIRSIERMTGIHRDTIMRLGVKVGKGCTHILDKMMNNLHCRRIQIDEIWGFIGKKQRKETSNTMNLMLGTFGRLLRLTLNQK